MDEFTNARAMAAFIRARADEDEEMARAGFTHPERWVRVAPTGIPNGLSCTAVLREIAAKRKLVDRLLSAMEDDFAPWNEDMLHTLAAIHDDHPDYEWAGE